MKYLATLLLILPFVLPAQNIPNPGFESWYVGQVILEAEDWKSSNFYTFNQFGVYSANPDNVNFTEGYTALRLTTTMLDTLGPYAGYMVSGSPMIDYQNNELDIMSGGTPFPHRPTKMLGQYQYQSNSPIEDFGQAHVILKKYNSATGQADTIGYGQNVLLNPTTGFQAFEVPIQYFVADVIPDSVIVIFYSTYPDGPIQGSELWVDDLSFDFTTGVSTPAELEAVTIYPNPFSESITIEATIIDKGTLELLSADGKIIASRDLDFGEQMIKFETSEIPNGNYYISWSNKKGESRILEQLVKVD